MLSRRFQNGHLRLDSVEYYSFSQVPSIPRRTESWCISLTHRNPTQRAHVRAPMLPSILSMHMNTITPPEFRTLNKTNKQTEKKPDEHYGPLENFAHATPA
jgi:hypothetical protein